MNMDFRFVSLPEYRANGYCFVTFRERAPDRIRREFLFVRPHHNRSFGYSSHEIDNCRSYLFLLCDSNKTIQDWVTVFKPCHHASSCLTYLIFHSPFSLLTLQRTAGHCPETILPRSQASCPSTGKLPNSKLQAPNNFKLSNNKCSETTVA